MTNVSDITVAPDITQDELKSEEARLIGQDPFKLIENGYFTIKTKKDGLKKFIPNVVQKRFLRKVREVFYAKKPVRFIILKARQMGISTCIEAVIYAFTSRMTGINACVIADDLDGANYIFEMQKLFQEYLDVHLKPEPKHSNEKKLAFKGINSQILIDTSDNPNAGRKYTFQFLHCTEVACWQRSLKEIMTGLGHAVPNTEGTMVFLETTARGYGEFYDLWIKAVHGKTDWIPLFYAWHEFPEYTMPLQGGLYPLDNINFVTPSRKEEFLIEEKKLKVKYNLSNEQLNYRRWDIVNNCSGDINQFNQEMPACWQDAFVASGDLFFDREALKLQVPKKPLVGEIVREEGRYVFRETPTGAFNFYGFPKRDGQYAIGGDSAEGLEQGDKCAACVIDKLTNETVCTYNNNVPPERFEDDLIKAGNFYNQACIACENKGYGYTVNQGLFKRYGNVYRRINTKKGTKEQTMELGYNTNSITRPTMLAQLAEEIKEGSCKLNDLDLINQCWTFINNTKKKRPEAEKGKNDDLVMSRAISSQVRLEKPFKEKFAGQRKVKRYRGLSGY